VRLRWWLPLLAPLLTAAAEPPYVAEIRFIGNEVTRERVLRQELTVREGDSLDAREIERSRQAIQNLGLFRRVDAELQGEGPGKTLLITVRERYYILPLPRLDGDLDAASLRYGLELRLDNLQGLNQRLILGFMQREYADDRVAERSVLAAYRYPRVRGTRFDLALSLAWTGDETVTVPGAAEEQLRRDTEHYSAGVSRWLRKYGPSQGWQLGLSLDLERRSHEGLTGEDPVIGSQRNVELGGAIAYLDVEDHHFWREGRSFGYRGAVGVPVLGSDYGHTHHELFYRHYRHFPRSGANLDWRILLGAGFGERFDEPLYRLGGGASLRGYDDEYVVGNALLLGSLEYHRPIPRYPQLRAVVFADVGNAYPRASAIDPADLIASAGAGLRWHVQRFVGVTLRVDWAYGFDAGTQRFHASTSVPF
jgi:outer membrane protein assembly factor BamA